MLKLAKLEIEIFKLLNLNIELNSSVNNFIYNSNWVTEIKPNYFEETKKQIEDLIEQNIDYSDETNFVFIENLYNKIYAFLELLNKKLNQYSSYEFDHEEWSVSLMFPKNAPSTSAMDLPEPSPANHYDDRGDYIHEIIIGFFNIESPNYGENSYEKTEDFSLEDILLEQKGVDKNELELIYAKAHLTYILALHEQMVQEIAQLLNTIILVYKLKNENKENLIKIVPEDLKLEFNLSKTELGYLFNNLYEIEIISKDNSDVKDKRTKLKNYIDAANMFYLDKNKFVKASRMNKTILSTNNTNTKEIQKEITFLNNFVERLKLRIDSLVASHDNLKKKGY